MPDNECDAACQKIIIDTGMAVFAMRMYQTTIDSFAALRAVDSEVPYFFIAAVLGEPNVVASCDCDNGTPALSGFYQVAQWLNRQKLTATQRATLTAQVQKDCYRSDDLIAWSLKTEAEIVAHAPAWTAKILDWVKDDQTVYTQLVAEVKVAD